MKIHKIETEVVLNSAHSINFKGHVAVKEILDYLEQKYPDKKDSHGEKVIFRGRAAHLEQDGFDSIKNFSFDENAKEFDIWEA